MEDSKVSNNCGASSVRNIDSSQLIVRLKKDHFKKLIDLFKFKLIYKELHERLVKIKKGAKLKADDKTFLLNYDCLQQRAHLHLDSL